MVTVYEDSIGDDISRVLLDGKVYSSKDKTGTLFDRDREITDMEEATYFYIAKLLEIPSKYRYIEAWKQKTNQLAPHCDFNVNYNREGADLSDESKFISPITVAIYPLISDNLEGGELCVSSRSWRDELPNPFNKTREYLQQFPYDKIKPKSRSIATFEGSNFYHWIEPITKGFRSSILLNFWTYPIKSS